MSFTPGAKLDSYEIVSLLGVGGMGEVYRARDSVLKREVAIKVLPAFISQDPERLRRFEQEAQAAAALNHPNILAVYQFGKVNGAPYMIAELLEGETLRRQLDRAPISTRKSMEYGVQIACGLGAAHEKGIVHRDLKPENLFITKDGRIKILDFGLAKLIQTPSSAHGDAPTLTHQTEPGVLMGTAGYMSPEQVRGTNVDHRADIFAFGAVLYEMISGNSAFRRATGIETMNAILNEDPPAISQVMPTVPPGMQKVVRRCLEKNPEQRFQSAHDLAFALETLSESGNSVSPLAVKSKSPTVPRWLVWAAAFFLLFAILAVVTYFIAMRSAPPSLRVSEYTQITRSGNAGEVYGTDGGRLYLAHSRYGIDEVSIAGGDLAPLQVGLPNPFLVDVSPDGSKLIVASRDTGVSLTEPLWSVDILGGAHQYLTAAMDASWSPDGKSVAYSTADGKLGLVQSDGTGSHTLASVAGPASSLSWSPDGKTIRFSMADGIWEMPSTGAAPRRLFPGSNGDTCCGHWSPDGNTFYFNSNSQIFAHDERRSLFRKPGPSVKLTTAPLEWGNPIPSKDGTRLFVLGSVQHGELTRFDRGTKLFQPYLGGISADGVAFSKDGQSIAYVSYPDCILWKSRLDGSARVQLSNPPMCPWLAEWSPDDAQISFVDFSDAGEQKAYIVASQGGSPRRLLPEDHGFQTDPTWSADGNKMVFSTSTGGGKDPNSVLKILDLKSNQTSTIPGSKGMFAARWSPDGQSIAAIREDSVTLNIFDVKTQRWSVPFKGVIGYPVWSSDSKQIYFLNFQENAAVYRVRIADGSVELILDLKDFNYTGNSGTWFGLDPTDAPLLLRNLGTHDVYCLTLGKK
jgi:serine/threonine protein kinase/Tol biopolymer transport system component